MAKRMLEPAQHNAAGMVSEQWNSAVQLQCAVRDAIDRDVSMVQAFEILIEHVRNSGVSSDEIREIQERLDFQAAALNAAKEDERKRIAATAGKR
jgi:hypothetical protein